MDEVRVTTGAAVYPRKPKVALDLFDDLMSRRPRWIRALWFKWRAGTVARDLEWHLYSAGFNERQADLDRAYLSAMNAQVAMAEARSK